jgi:hypothetical protein
MVASLVAIICVFLSVKRLNELGKIASLAVRAAPRSSS